MLRENEFLRERMAQREYDKIEKATEKIQDKADALANYKNMCYPLYAPPPVYMTPRIETTKIIESHTPCHSSCHCDGP